MFSLIKKGGKKSENPKTFIHPYHSKQSEKLSSFIEFKMYFRLGLFKYFSQEIYVWNYLRYLKHFRKCSHRMFVLQIKINLKKNLDVMYLVMELR